ncbi:MAG: hypothetical protein GX144_08045, partial [Clostridiaceae bacterium]|nr:hypothetical protein [Clostridiaceae bacterium]
MKRRGLQNVGGEWFKITLEELKATYIAVRDRVENIESRTRDFRMRPEQKEAVGKTIEYYKSAEAEKNRTAIAPK